MNYSKETNPFYEIDYCGKVVFFNKSHPIERDLFNDTYKFINLNNDVLLKAITDKYNISKLPCVLIYGNKYYLDENSEKDLSNINITSLMDRTIETILNSAEVVLFMKGSIKEPYCRFSKGLVTFLKDVEYDLDSVVYYDILLNDEMRERIKEVNQWPTYPQLFVNGHFVGGFDIVKQLFESQELQKMLIK